MKEFSLKYTDERDKTYGIAGMAITLAVCDGLHMLREVDCDDEPGNNMHMVSAIELCGNPRMSAKSVWSQTIKDLRAITSMVLGNIACRRRMLSNRGYEDFEEPAIKELVREQAMQYCSLDSDESDVLYENCHSYVRRIFSHGGMVPVIEQFSQRLNDRRRMSAAEVLECLTALGVR